MKTINLERIVEQQELDINDIAKQLFPGNKYPRLSFNRVKAGEAVLDANQISKLSMLSGLSISQLFSETPWKASTKSNIHTFMCTNFRAELDNKTWELKIFDRNTLFHEEVLLHKSVTVSDCIKLIESQISKFKKDEN